MARFLIKHEALPATWARLSEKGDKVAFGAKEKATEFASAEEALAAFEKAALAMAAAAKKKERAMKAGGTAPKLRYGEELIEKIAPVWLRKKMGWKADWQSKATGVFVAEATGLDESAGAPFELFYARSEKGWLGEPRLKSRFGAFDWRDDMAQARAFVSEQALEAALASAGSVAKVSRFKASAVFTEARLHPEADEVSQGIAAGVESREIQADLEPKPEPKAKPGRGGRI